MGESSDSTAVVRRATWVGLRTLRQRPKVVGETASGDPVFEVRSVRLVLHHDASHFTMLTQCARCGREVPGAPVLSAFDLDRPAHPVICKDCVRASVGSTRPEPERRQVKSEPPTAGAPRPEVDDRSAEGTQPVDDGRLAAMEAQLQLALGRLDELAAAQRVDGTDADVQKARRDGLAELRAEVTASAEGTAARLAALEAQARQSIEVLGRAVEGQRGRVADLSAALDEARAEVRRLTESNEEIVRRQQEISLRLAEMAGTTPGDGTTALVEELNRRIDEGVNRASAQATSLERRLRGDVVTLTQMVETVRGDLESSLGAPVRSRLAALTQAVEELARGRKALQAKLDGIVGRATDAEARVAALASAVDDGDKRLRALELRTRKSIEGLTAVIDTHGRQLGVVLAASQRTATDPQHEAPTGASGAGQLLDGLERQLLEAEGRLARLAGTAGDRGR